MDMNKVKDTLKKLGKYEEETPIKSFVQYMLNAEVIEGEMIVDKREGVNTITYLQEEWIVWGKHAIRSIGFELFSQELIVIADAIEEGIVKAKPQKESGIEDMIAQYIGSRETAKMMAKKNLSDDVLSRLTLFAMHKTKQTLRSGSDIGTIYKNGVGWMEVMKDIHGIKRWWNYNVADWDMHAFYIRLYNEDKIDEPILFDKMTGKFTLIS